jgi:FkbM family methyltransferase
MADPSPPDGAYVCNVRFGGRGIDILLDAHFDDPIAQTFRAGQVWCPHLCDLMLTLVKPGDALLDLGAHLGSESLPAAAAGCRVVAVEASRRNAELLQASAERNGFTQMRVVHAAAGASEGTADFSPHGPWGHVYSDATKMASVPTRVAAVDDLVREVGWTRVDFLKMDIEGSEISALRGMEHLLGREDAPLLLYESNAGGLKYYNQTVQALKREVERFGYANFLVQPNRVLRPVQADDVQPEYNVDYLAWKRRPAHLGRWRIGPPLSRREIQRMLIHSVEAADANQMVYLEGLLGKEGVSRAQRIMSWRRRLRRTLRFPVRLARRTQARLAWIGRLLRRSA